MKKSKETKRNKRLLQKKKTVSAGQIFSEIEDASNAYNIIQEIVFNAGLNAAAEAKAAGLPLTYASGTRELVKVSPSGERIKISPIIGRSSFYIKYQPSSFFYAVRK